MASSGRRSFFLFLFLFFFFAFLQSSTNPQTTEQNIWKSQKNHIHIFLILSIFCCYTSQPDDVVGWLLVHHVSRWLSSHSSSSSSSSLLCHLKAQNPSTCRTPPQKQLHRFNGYTLIFALFRCRSRKGGNDRRALLLEDFYVFWTSMFKVPTLRRLLKGRAEFTRWHRRTSSPWTGSPTLAPVTIEGPLWHELRSMTSSLLQL